MASLECPYSKAPRVEWVGNDVVCLNSSFSLASNLLPSNFRLRSFSGPSPFSPYNSIPSTSSSFVSVHPPPSVASLSSLSPPLSPRLSPTKTCGPTLFRIPHPHHVETPREECWIRRR